MSDGGNSVRTGFDRSRERYEGLIRHVIPEHERHDALIAEAVGDAAPQTGGVFVNSDMIAGVDESAAVAMIDEWRRYVHSRGDDPDEWQQWLVGEDDQPATEGQQSAWLRSAGFAEVETIWKMAGFAIVRATKALGGD